MKQVISNNADNKLRLFILNLIIIASTIIIAFYLFYLQIIKGFEFKEKAINVTLREIPIPAQRGLIYDRNYNIPLVNNIDSFAVNMIPGYIDKKEREKIFESLSSALSISVDEIKRKVPTKYYGHYQPIEIKSAVSFKTVSNIAENIENFNGITWNSKPIRGYRDNTSISHIVGYVGDITTEELILLYNQGYNYSSTIGKSGIEKQYDDILRGKDGKSYKVVDVKEKQLETNLQNEIPPEPGKTLVLTIDRNLQQLCEKALGERIGAVVVLKPATGEVLAMVSYPWYDPNIFYSEGGLKKYDELRMDPRYPFLNRTVQSAYPPASTFKILMSTAFIEEKAFPITQLVNCSGKMILGDRVAKCWQEYGHGKLDFFGGLENSCNVYFWTVGVYYLKIDNIVRYAKEFGLGVKTGIDLPEESSGFLPTPEWKLNTRNTPWFAGDTMNMSIGQGFTTATPLQLADATAFVANEGKIYKPHILKEIRDPITGQIIKSVNKEVIHEAQISDSTFKLVQEAMRKVVTKGTARYFITTNAVEVAGKTGSSETGIEEFYHSWFTSFAPYQTDNPDDRIVVTAIVEGFSALKEKWWASKTANIIYQGYFAHQTFEEAMVTLYPWLKNQYRIGNE